MSRFEQLHITNWNSLTPEARFNALQQLENYYSQIQGRPSCKIVDTSNPNIWGSYNNGVIQMNKKELLQEGMCYEAVNTILHEGRHAFQEYAIRNHLSSVDSNTLENWKSEMYGGYLIEYPEFWAQSIERDASQYAYQETEKIYKELKRKIGKNDGFKDYDKRTKKFAKRFEKDLKRLYGRSYQSIVNQKVKNKYNILNKIQLEQSTNNAILLNQHLEKYIHNTEPHLVCLEHFMEHMQQKAIELGHNHVSNYLKNMNQAEKKHDIPSKNQRFQKPTQLSFIEKLEKIYETLTKITYKAQKQGVMDQAHRLKTRINTFTQVVQKTFQKQYPQLQLKPFRLHTSKTAIDILKHNQQAGKRIEPEKFRDLGIKQVEINGIIEKGRNHELTR